MDISCCILLIRAEIPGDSILAISETREESLLSSFYCYAVSSRSEAKKSPTDGWGRDESKGLAVDKSPQEYLSF